MVEVLFHVRVAKVPEQMLNNLSRREQRYYEKQAWKVAQILNHKIIQSLLRELIDFENIDPAGIEDVRVMVLPSVREKEYGDHLFGLYDPDECRISIYPAIRYKGSKFLKDPMVSFQFIRESFDTLIHEVLHLKYSNESTVKKLTRKYLRRFYQMLSKYLE